MTSHDRRVWAPSADQSVVAVWVLTIVTGLAMPIFFFTVATENPIGWDFIAYISAAEAFLAGEDFIGLEPDHGRGEYVYPPIVVLGFVPYALIGNWSIAFGIHLVINLAILTTCAILTIRAIEDLGTTLTVGDRLLITTVFTVSLYPMIALGQGQIDPLVALALIAVMIGVERGRWRTAGGAFAVAGVIKLFPFAFGLWLARLRYLRAIVVAGGGAIAAALASVAVFGIDLHQSYWTLITDERSRLDAFAEGMSPNFFDVTLVRPAAALLGDLPAITYVVVAVVIVAVPLAYVYRTVDTPEKRYITFLATLVGVMIALPSTNLNHLLYLYFPLLVLSYRLPPGRDKHLLVAGIAMLAIPLQPRIIVTIVDVIGLPTASIDTVVTAILGTVPIALMGALLILAGCAVFAHKHT